MCPTFKSITHTLKLKPTNANFSIELYTKALIFITKKIKIYVTEKGVKNDETNKYMYTTLISRYVL